MEAYSGFWSFIGSDVRLWGLQGVRQGKPNSNPSSAKKHTTPRTPPSNHETQNPETQERPPAPYTLTLNPKSLTLNPKPKKLDTARTTEKTGNGPDLALGGWSTKCAPRRPSHLLDELLRVWGLGFRV